MSATIEYQLNNTTMALSKFRWKALLGIIAVWVAIAMNWNWIWGVIFIVWVIPEIRNRVAYFIEDVERSRNPVVYWLIIATWILLSAYALVTAISPRFNPESAQFVGYQNSGDVRSLFSGSYSNEPKPYGMLPLQQDTLGTDSTAMEKRDTLPYEIHESEEMFFVGISVLTTFKEDQYASDMEALWTYFYQEDISYVIPNILENRVYMLYSDYDKEYKDYFRLTLGYRTSDTADVYEGLRGAHVPPARFAVVEAQDTSMQAVGNLWAEVWDSDLPQKNDFDLEVYFLDRSYNIEKTELWISVKEEE